MPSFVQFIPLEDQYYFLSIPINLQEKSRKIVKFIGHPFRNRKYRIGVGLKRSKRDQPFIRVTLHVRVHGLIFCLHKQDS